MTFQRIYPLIGILSLLLLISSCSTLESLGITRHNRYADIDNYQVVQRYSPLTTVDEVEIQQGLTIYRKTLAAQQISSERIEVMTARLQQVFTEINNSNAQSMTPVVNGIAEMRAFMDTLKISGAISAPTHAFLAEVPGAIICQRAGCSVVTTIAGKRCGLIANIPWIGGWICVYLCNPF